MNRRDKDVLIALSSREYTGQRELAENCGCSLGAINASVKNLLKKELIDENMQLTEKSISLLEICAPERAILLAAGFGIKMSLFDAEIPKALLKVRGEILIERLISQLHQVGIYEIYIVVGFAKERFEYLIDKYGVELIVNSEYAQKGNLHSLMLAGEYLANSYVVPCDLWCRNNPFNKKELYSWYMVSDAQSPESFVRVNRKQELVVVSSAKSSNKMVGISYILKEDADIIGERLCNMDADRRYKGAFWEETLYENDKFLISSRVIGDDEVFEIDSIEDLRELDRERLLPTGQIAKALGVEESDITDMDILKKGMTNRSFCFSCKGQRYILRIPEDDSIAAVNHKNESIVYQAVEGKGIADDVVYFDLTTGMKISKYITDAHFCDSDNEQEVIMCMQKLRQFHNLKLKVKHEFDLFETINYFESLWKGTDSVYVDYKETKKNIFSLKPYIDSLKTDKCLTHIDAVPDNFLIPDGCDDSNDIKLIDWEYAAMQDPHVDIAMYCLYAMYNKKQVDFLIDAYFNEGCRKTTRLKIYCYIAIGGLLWSNWCEYKIKKGAEFGEYSIKQYRFAKEYCKIVKKELEG